MSAPDMPVVDAHGDQGEAEPVPGALELGDGVGDGPADRAPDGAVEQVDGTTVRTAAPATLELGDVVRQHLLQPDGGVPAVDQGVEHLGLVALVRRPGRPTTGPSPCPAQSGPGEARSSSSKPGAASPVDSRGASTAGHCGGA